MQSGDDSKVEWTGVQPDLSPIEPLDDKTFPVRLRLLSDRAAGLSILRKTFAQQQPYGEQLPRNPEPAS